MLTAPIRTIPCRIYAAFSNYGAELLQCPHQGAEMTNCRTVELDQPELVDIEHRAFEVVGSELIDGRAVREEGQRRDHDQAEHEYFGCLH